MSASYSDISFSKVAPRYNQIKTLPAEMAAQVGAALAGLLPPGAAVLDLGCGAGRIAVPAAAAGLRVTGIDRDEAMLAEAARSAAEAGQSLELIHDDITAMPLPADHFDAVLSINVLHLVPAWQQALTEALRVMRPGGLFIQGHDWIDPASCAARLRNMLRKTVVELQPDFRPNAVASPGVMAQALAQAGGTSEPDIIAAAWTFSTSPATILAQMAAREYNEIWALDPKLLSAVVERLREWAAATWDNLDASETIESRFVLSVTRGLRG